MPVQVEPRDVSSELEGVSSVLIVSCPVCPPMCLSMQKESPFIDFFKRGIKTGAFEDHIKSLREPLERRGVRTGVYSVHTPTPMMCLWTEGQRRRFLKRARDFEAVVVLGCDSGVVTANAVLEDTDCRVVQGMETHGLVNATTQIRFPLKVTMRANLDPEDDTAGLPKTGPGRAGESRRAAAS